MAAYAAVGSTIATISILAATFSTVPLVSIHSQIPKEWIAYSGHPSQVAPPKSFPHLPSVVGARFANLAAWLRSFRFWTCRLA